MSDKYVGYLTPKGHAAINFDIYYSGKNGCYKVEEESDPVSNIPALLDDLPTTFLKENVKLFIINLFDFNHPNYPNNTEFCQKLTKVLQKNKCKYYFVSNEMMELNMILARQTLAKFDALETLCAKSRDIFTIVLKNNEMDVTVLQKTKSNQFIISNRRTVKIKKDYFIDMVCDEILGNNIMPSEIFMVVPEITREYDTFLVKLKNALNYTNLNICKDFKWDPSNAIARMTDPQYSIQKTSEYFITRQTSKVFMVGTMNSFDNRDYHKDDVIIQTELNKNIEHRHEKTGLISRSNWKLYIGTLSPDLKTCQMLPPEDIYNVACHKVFVSLRIDENNNPTLYQEPTNSPIVMKFPETLTSSNTDLTEKFPAIGFSDNFSVICLWNAEKNCYEFSKNWNGMYGKDLLLSFKDKKPKLTDKYDNNRSYIVYDILKIMSMPQCVDKIIVDPDWGFEITEDDGNPVLLEFDDHSGDRCAALPSFLMAIMLKEHLKSIRRETGKNYDKIIVMLLDNYATQEAQDRAKKLLEESFERLKISVNVGCYPVKEKKVIAN